jgi:hypothetical protein
MLFLCRWSLVAGSRVRVRVRVRVRARVRIRARVVGPPA